MGQRLEEERQRLERVAARQAAREATSRSARVSAWFGVPSCDVLLAGEGAAAAARAAKAAREGGDAAAGAVDRWRRLVRLLFRVRGLQRAGVLKVTWP